MELIQISSICHTLYRNGNKARILPKVASFAALGRRNDHGHYDHLDAKFWELHLEHVQQQGSLEIGTNALAKKSFFCSTKTALPASSALKKTQAVLKQTKLARDMGCVWCWHIRWKAD